MQQAFIIWCKNAHVKKNTSMEQNLKKNVEMITALK